jgi:hypothetical protein
MCCRSWSCHLCELENVQETSSEYIVLLLMLSMTGTHIEKGNMPLAQVTNLLQLVTQFIYTRDKRAGTCSLNNWTLK